MKTWFNRMVDKAASWRLPVVIPVPNRDNLIAMGLMALSVGLLVGVAIGPLLGPAGSAVAGIVAPSATAPTEDTTTAATDTTNPAAEGVALQSPAGSESSSSTTVAAATPDTTSTGIPASTDTTTDYEPTPDPAAAPTDQIDPAPADPDPVPVENGSELKGTVVGTQPDGGDYDVADSSGNVLSLHATEPPAVGDEVTTRIESLSNGTFGELGDREVKGENLKSKLRGVTSWVDPATDLMVISSRGSSLAVDITGIPDDQAGLLAPGSPVEAIVSFTEPVEATEDSPARPPLFAEEIQADEELSDRIELSGLVKAVDAEARTITMAADSNGTIAADMVLEAPKRLDLEPLTVDRTYNVSAGIEEDGTFTITGLSPDYSRKAADDSAAAFGDQR